MRLAREIAAQDEAEGSSGNLEAIVESHDDDNKIYIAMGVSKTISTVSIIRSHGRDINFFFQVVTSVESSPEILLQVQETIIPIILFTLEHKIIGETASCTARRGVYGLSRSIRQYVRPCRCTYFQATRYLAEYVACL